MHPRKVCFLNYIQTADSKWRDLGGSFLKRMRAAGQKVAGRQAAGRIAAGVILALLPGTYTAWAWGKTGHAVVADIAEAHLTPEAAAEVHRLLAVEGDQHMSDISSWADKAKEEHLAGSPSHTIRLPIDGSAPGPHPCPGHFCADDALKLYGDVLADKSKPDAEREVALKYIVHLVGDLQQPLHGTNATGQMPVIFRGQQMTLHAVWDDGIIDAHGGSAKQIAAALIEDEHGVPSGGDPMDWAREDLAIAQHDIYNDVPLHPQSVITLPPGYAAQKWPIVQLRLTEGGLRLARLLNQLLN
jgi:hypothetical protein